MFFPIWKIEKKNCVHIHETNFMKSTDQCIHDPPGKPPLQPFPQSLQQLNKLPAERRTTYRLPERMQIRSLITSVGATAFEMVT